MGWRGTLRSLNAAANRARRDAERQQRAHARHNAKIQNGYERLLQRARRIDGELSSDPVKALKATFANGNFVLAQFALNEPPFFGTVQLADGRAETNFTPPRYERASAFIEPLGIALATFAIFVEIRVGHDDPRARLRTNWLKRNRAESLVFLLDPEHHEYYFPISTNLSGEVLPGCAFR